MSSPAPQRPEDAATPRSSPDTRDDHAADAAVVAGRSARRALDPAALARAQARMQAAPQPPWLHGEVARRMAQRLAVIRLRPARIVDWGAFLGASQGVLEAAYPQATRLAVESTAARVADTEAALRSPWWSPRRWRSGKASAQRAASLQPGCAQLVWSNMGLHGVIDPQAEMVAWHRALEVEGFLMFSTLGPGTLRGLSEIYAAQAWPVPMAPLVDMHDLGDMLVEAGFADPVMDQETITLTWSTAAALLAELRQLGANVDPRRTTGLRTPRWRAGLESKLAARAGADGRIALEFELVYGHAFRAPPRPKIAARTELALDDMRAMVRGSGRRA